jgi:hypothetical protein
MVHSIYRQLNSPAWASNKEPPFFLLLSWTSNVGLSPGLDFTILLMWYGKVRLPPQGLLLVWLAHESTSFTIVRQVD